MTPTNKLKPCPFCGEKARFWHDAKMAVIHCSNCNAGNVRNEYEDWDAKEKVIEAWNRRTT
jgi:Lar family restriction alleviation protein